MTHLLKNAIEQYWYNNYIIIQGEQIMYLRGFVVRWVKIPNVLRSITVVKKCRAIFIWFTY